MKKRIITILLALVLMVVVMPINVSADVVPAWNATIPASVPEPIIVKVDSTVLPNGYQFQAVNLKLGEVHTKTITVINNGSTALMVSPIVTSTSNNITAVWTIGGSGRSIAAGESFDFVLTLTAVNVTESISIPIGFTRE